MIETKESREQFAKRREKAREAMRCALSGELPLAVEKKVVRAVELAAAQTSVAAPKPEPSGARFDKVAYQREYMRKRRAKKKITHPV